MSTMNQPDKGCVSAATPEAALCGADVLAEGGNAVDAAVAVSLALCVSEPAGSGIGGQCTFIVHPPGGEPFVISGTSRAPAGVPESASLSDLTGRRASTVPSLLRVLDFAWRTYGSGRLSWPRLVGPAVRLAEDGYALGSFRHKALLRHARDILCSGGATRLLFEPDGSVPDEGSVIYNPVLARTLERIAMEGAYDFYEGVIAEAIATDMRANGGWITLDDLRDLPEPPVLAPIHGTYRGWDVYTLPPPSAAWTVIMALNILENAPEGELAFEGARRTVRIADALMIAHRYRVMQPVADLFDYEEAVAFKTGKAKARKIAGALQRTGLGETTHFSVADSAGMAVGVTQSLNSYFGARTACPGMGFLYNDYMRELMTGSPHHPYTLKPGAMPYSSMSACVLAVGGRPCLVLGSPGDERIISAVAQVISHWVDVGDGIEAAVEAPRLHTLRTEEVLLETRPQGAEALLGLEARGYTIHLPLSSLFAGDLNPYFGGVHAVARENGQWQGAADPRRDGAVAFAGSNGKTAHISTLLQGFGNHEDEKDY